MKKYSNLLIGIVKGSIKTMRPKQWYKQSIVFLAVVFSGQLLSIIPVVNTILTVIAFSLVASGIYTLNDISDVEEDRKHPRKKNRPIPSGQLPLKIAFINSLALCATGLLIGYFVHVYVLTILLIYIFQNILYSFILSSIAVIDVLIISIGFVLRALDGVYAVRDSLIIPSKWLILCTFLAALLLGLGKRYKEPSDLSTRESMYSSANLESYLDITSAMICLSYILYTVLDSGIIMMVTIPTSIYAVFRYRFLIETADSETSIGSLIVHDNNFIINFLVWTLLIIVVLYMI
jgi:4-hydroxybenzoate polyprenyltransferase